MADGNGHDVRWVFGKLEGYGVDVKGMDLSQAIDKLDMLEAGGKTSANKEPSPEKKVPTKKIVKVNLNSEYQKKFDSAKSPKERRDLAFNYIIKNLRGKYTAQDGRTVIIDRVGAKKMTYRDIEVKLRVAPELANLIKAGTLEGVVEAKKEDGQPHKRFTHFAYYKVCFKIGNDRFVGMLNVGIGKDGRSTLYDLNPFNKE